MDRITLGAVAYDPKVVTIWEGFRAWFATQGLELDFVLYQNYERQVLGTFRREHDIAWDSPLAWLQTERLAAALGCRAIGSCMRDTDQGLTSVLVVRADSGIRTLSDLRGRTVAVGAPDSPQATLIPLRLLQAAGLEPGRDFAVQVHDVLAGKHGDHVGGERLAAAALVAGHADAACMIDGNHLAFSADGTLPPGSSRILTSSPPYDHCIFAALDSLDPALLARFEALLRSQRHDDPAVRPLLDLEGLKEWRPGRTTGFQQLADAIDHLPFAGAREVRAFLATATRELSGERAR